jgi:hypothetical protein
VKISPTLLLIIVLIKIKLDFPRGEKPPKVDLRYRHHYFSR